ncbi:MAG: flagellar hook assembly protein FlgD [Hyphomonadaceae bacterium]
MAVDSVSGASAAAQTNAQSRTQLSDNFDTFLVLLTAQLQNQDPLSPMDSTQFTQQLVQFSQVEQQIRSNESLETLIAQNNAAAAQLPLSYLGKAALLESSRATLFEDSQAQWTYSFEKAPASVTLNVKDASGRVVFSTQGLAAAGAHNFAWDGTKTDGETAAPGVYTLSVTATDEAGANQAADVNVIEIVSGVDFTSGSPRVVTSSGAHDLDDVLGILNR